MPEETFLKPCYIHLYSLLYITRCVMCFRIFFSCTKFLSDWKKSKNGQFQKISIHHNGPLFGIPRARGVGILWTGIPRARGCSLNWKAWGSTYIWNSEGLKMLTLWMLPVRKWSTTEQCASIDLVCVAESR